MPPLEWTPSAFATLLRKRVLFFTGKGGVGKTTVATAVALTAARAGKKTLLVEISDSRRAASLLGLSPSEDSTNTLRVFSPRLSVLSTSGATALEEYLHLIIPARRLVRILIESRPYQYFIAAAPGLKELLTLGKIWYEERRKDAATQQPRWDLLVVDLPATGHGLQYLAMPSAARDTFQDGVIHREAQRIATWLQDADTTAVNLVTLAEELPVSETQDTCEQLANQLRLPLGLLFVNRVRATPASLKRLSRPSLPTAATTSERQLAEHIFTRARTEALLAEEQAAYLRQLRQLGLPLVSLPFCFASAFGLAEVESLSRQLEHAPGEAPTTSRAHGTRTTHSPPAS